MKILLCLLFTLCGCATTLEDCQRTNWRNLGEEDAMKGRESNSKFTLLHQCREQNFPINEAEYAAGHAGGVQKLCTYHYGFELGRTGRPISSLCQGKASEEFGKGHVLGKIQYEQREQRAREFIYKMKKDETAKNIPCTTELNCTIPDTCVDFICTKSGKSCTEHVQCEIRALCNRQNQCVYQ
ncbi:MAG: DUF2799 domain-containing protein [Bdellovibrionota bacterium]